jgi:hypothetical protein
MARADWSLRLPRPLVIPKVTTLTTLATSARSLRSICRRTSAISGRGGTSPPNSTKPLPAATRLGWRLRYKLEFGRCSILNRLTSTVRDRFLG